MIRTSRLILRQWQASDLPPYAALNADPEVRRFWPDLLSREESDDQARGFQHHIQEYGFGFWAVEVVGVAPFVGFTGIRHVDYPAPYFPAVEIGWRFAREHWGKGYATEAAEASLADGFDRVGLSEIVACAVLTNAASRRVMDRIGMKQDMACDFDLPRPEGPLRRAVTYRIRKNENDGKSSGHTTAPKEADRGRDR